MQEYFWGYSFHRFTGSPSPVPINHHMNLLLLCGQVSRFHTVSKRHTFGWHTHKVLSHGSVSSLFCSSPVRLLYSRSRATERDGWRAEQKGQVFSVIGSRCVNNDLPWYGSQGPQAMIGCPCINIPSLSLLQASIYKPQVRIWRTWQTQWPYF